MTRAATTTVRRCARRAAVQGSGGGALGRRPRPPLLRQRCGSWGSEGGRSIGRSIPSPKPGVDTLGMLTYAQVGLPARAQLW